MTAKLQPARGLALKAVKKRKRNPQDATLRNVRALKKKLADQKAYFKGEIAELKARLKALEVHKIFITDPRGRVRIKPFFQTDLSFHQR